MLPKASKGEEQYVMSQNHNAIFEYSFNHNFIVALENQILPNEGSTGQSFFTFVMLFS